MLENQWWWKTSEKHERVLLQPVFCLSLLGYCRNMVMQHDGPRERGPVPSVNKCSSFEDIQNTMIPIFRWLHTNENILMNIIFNFCNILPIDSLNSPWTFKRCLDIFQLCLWWQNMVSMSKPNQTLTTVLSKHRNWNIEKQSFNISVVFKNICQHLFWLLVVGVFFTLSIKTNYPPSTSLH